MQKNHLQRTRPQRWRQHVAAMQAPPAGSPTSTPRTLHYITEIGSDTRRERDGRCSPGSPRDDRKNQPRNRHRKNWSQRVSLPICRAIPHLVTNQKSNFIITGGAMHYPVKRDWVDRNAGHRIPPLRASHLTSERSRRSWWRNGESPLVPSRFDRKRARDMLMLGS
jgi:hypothetical protein